MKNVHVFIGVALSCGLAACAAELEAFRKAFSVTHLRETYR